MSRGVFLTGPYPYPQNSRPVTTGAGFPSNSRGLSKYLIYIFNYYLIICKIFNKHPSKFNRGGRRGSKHERTPRRCHLVFGLYDKQREDTGHETTCSLVSFRGQCVCERRRNDAEHETTPTWVLFRVRRVSAVGREKTPTTKRHQRWCRFVFGVCGRPCARRVSFRVLVRWCGGGKMPNTKSHQRGVVMCSACDRKHAEHKITPTRVWFRARRVREAFVEKVDKEEILLVTLTSNQVNKN